MDAADESTNTMEVPFRFLPSLVSGLAYCIAMKRAPARMADLKVSYEEDFFRAATEDRDRTSLQLVPTANSIQVM